MTLEKLLDVEVPKRAQYLRVIVMELAELRTILSVILGVDTGATLDFFMFFSV
jgi:NADH-quinone oxidoreductase subunit D